MRSVPYAAIRIVAGLLAVGWSLYQLLGEGSWLDGIVGVVAFIVGWFVARRFARPAGPDRPWLDTLLPIAVAAFAIAPAVAYPFIGQISFALAAADFVLLFAGVSLGLASGPYANEKVALAGDGVSRRASVPGAGGSAVSFRVHVAHDRVGPVDPLGRGPFH